jgi:outer membrane receptor for ferrienterochelin and colicins
MMLVDTNLLEAQNKSADTSQLNKLQHLSELVVTGQYGESSLTKSIYKVKLIDAKRIQAQGAVNLKDVLSNELNIRINQDPLLGSSISLQGVSGQSIKILLDGVPVIGREGGNIDLSQINLNNVERIEIVEGPMSVNFGTDALGGVLNIITKKPKQNELKANLNTYYESVGTYNADLGLGLANTKWNSQLNFGRNFFQGYSQDEKSRVMLWKPREQYFGDINFGKIIKDGSLKFQNNIFNEKISNKGEVNINIPLQKANANDSYYFTRRITSSLFYDKKVTANRHINMLVSYSNYRRMLHTYYKNMLTLSESLIPEADLQDTNYFNQYMSRATYSYNNKNSKINYQLGYDVNYETAEGNKIQGTYRGMGDYSLFGSTEIKVNKKFTARPGMRLTYNTLYVAPINPSLNLKYDISERVFLRMSYARGFRTPSLKELYLNFVDPSHNIQGNTNLQAETSNNLQAFLTYQYKTDKKLFRLEPSVFYNKIDNMIDLARTDSINLKMKYVNVNQFESIGLNVNTEYKTSKFNLSLGYAYIGVKNILLNSPTSNEFFFNHQGRVNASYTFKNELNISIFCKLNGFFQAYQYDNISNKVKITYYDAFSICDATASKSIFNRHLSLTAGIKNIFNVVNVNASYMSGYHSTQSNSAMTGVGRTFFVAIRYQISKTN